MPTAFSSKTVLGGLIVGLAALAALAVVYRDDLAWAFKTLAKAARSEAELLSFNLKFEGNKGESGFSQPTLLVIAHAGGAVAGERYRNALEGLAQSAERGCRYMEIDFNWTSDGKLVAIHSWSSFFDEPLAAVPTEQEFTSRVRADGLTQMTFADVTAWLAAHPGISLVTDIKVRNLEALRLMAKTNIRDQIVPQVYRFPEFEEARKLGYSRVIFTNYVAGITESALVRFAAKARPYAVTVPRDRASQSLADDLHALNVALFTHPVDSVEEVRRLPRRIKGIYSSSLCGLTVPAE